MSFKSDKPVVDTRAAFKLMIALAAVFLILVCRLYWLHVLPHPERLRVVSAETSRPQGSRPIHLMFEQPYRGRILDRKGRVLAQSWYAHDVVIDGKEIVAAGTVEERREAAERASALVRTVLADAGVPCDPRDVHRRVLRAVTMGEPYEVLARGLDPDHRRRFIDRLRQSLRPSAQAEGKPRLRAAGLRTVPRLRRTYPWGGITSQIVGVVGESEHDAEERIAGRTGFELMAEGVLSGRPGFLRAERDSAGRRLMPEWAVQEKIVRGGDVVLTLDAEIQDICMDALSRSVTERKAERGIAVVLDVRTGDILAAASYPTASPDLSAGESARHLNAFAIMDLYEPGSVIKPIIVSWGLETRRLRLDASWDCGGGDGAHHFVNGRHRRLVREYRANPGALTTEQVVIKSSNIGSVRILMDLGLEAVWEAFGSYELAGQIKLAYPYTERARYTTPGMVANNPSYNALDTACSFGQGYEIMLSPLGMARMYLPFARDGSMPQVSLVKEIIRGPKRVTRPTLPSPRRVVGEDVAQQMRQVLTRVVEEGTGKVLRGMDWSAAAKTGTPKVTRTGHYNPVVCTFAPASKPEIVVSVVHKNVTPRLTGGAYTGGKVSGPVAREIVTRTLNYLQVPSDQ
ncbi:MAG: hypothetical protein CMJ90_10815 [Planctomycetes bacterium]|nr:hypothetical protein [Planctomycetota bacterium]